MGINWVGAGSVFSSLTRSITGLVRKTAGRKSSGLIRSKAERKRYHAARMVRMDKRRQAVKASGFSPRLATLSAFLIMFGVAVVILAGVIWIIATSQAPVPVLPSHW